MNRVIVIQLQNGKEQVLAHFTLKNQSNGPERMVEVKFPHSSQVDIFHFSFTHNEVVLRSSTNLGWQLKFFPSWSFKLDGYRCEVVHGGDLLDSIYKEILDSGLE